MARQDYQRRLDELRTDVCAMADLVLDRYETALDAYETGDEALAEAVIEGDHEVNERYLEIEADCVELLALQQPVAGDLRFIASSFKIVTDLERIGDLATNLAGYGAVDAEPLVPAEAVRELGETASEMLEDAMTAYEHDDAEATWEIADRDDDLDAACQAVSEQIVRELLETEFDDRSPEAASALLDEASRSLLTIRDIERVGDHAVNISARTLYMVEHDAGLLY